MSLGLDILPEEYLEGMIPPDPYENAAAIYSLASHAVHYAFKITDNRSDRINVSRRIVSISGNPAVARTMIDLLLALDDTTHSPAPADISHDNTTHATSFVEYRRPMAITEIRRVASQIRNLPNEFKLDDEVINTILCSAVELLQKYKPSSPDSPLSDRMNAALNDLYGCLQNKLRTFTYKVLLRKNHGLRDRSVEEFVAAGQMGLYEAVMKFDTSSDEYFLRYAFSYIRYRAVDFIREEGARGLSRSEYKFYTLDDGKTSDEELAHKTNKPQKNIAITRDIINRKLTEYGSDDISLMTGFNKAVSIHGDIPQTPEEVVVEQMQQYYLGGILAQAMHVLSEQQQEAVRLYFYEDKTLKEIGKLLGFTESRASQIVKSAVDALRERIEHIKNVSQVL